MQQPKIHTYSISHIPSTDQLFFRGPVTVAIITKLSRYKSARVKIPFGPIQLDPLQATTSRAKQHRRLAPVTTRILHPLELGAKGLTPEPVTHRAQTNEQKKKKQTRAHRTSVSTGNSSRPTLDSGRWSCMTRHYCAALCTHLFAPRACTPSSGRPLSASISCARRFFALSERGRRAFIRCL